MPRTRSALVPPPRAPRFALCGLKSSALALLCAPCAAALSAPPPKAPPSLPLRQVVLFSSGVGYFQREGTVEGDTRVDLSFQVQDINDLLKSMVLEDQDGGTISTVTYGSKDPITKTLKTFATGLKTNPTSLATMAEALDLYLDQKKK